MRNDIPIPDSEPSDKGEVDGFLDWNVFNTCDNRSAYQDQSEECQIDGTKMPAHLKNMTEETDKHRHLPRIWFAQSNFLYSPTDQSTLY
jgi:hypothetical protein